MRATTRLAWSVLGIAAFGATAALAVFVSSHAPVRASLVSAPDDPACSVLRVWAEPDRIEFTNSSAVACELSGYPAVEAAGATTGRLVSPMAVVELRQGATAHAVVEVSARGCHRPATVSGFMVGLPGNRGVSRVGYRARACSVRVGAIQPGAR